MSWKIAKLIRLRPLSLSSKLMLFNGISTLCILLAISLFMYPTYLALIAKLTSIKAYYLVAHCKRRIIVGLVLSAIGAFIAGGLAARKGLKAINQFSSQVKEISATSLNKRVNLENLSVEFNHLGIEFNSMLDRLQNSFDKLTQFSSDLSHELRTPLNNLIGRTELALTRNDLTADHRSLLEAHMEEYHYLSKLVENMLFLARSEQRQIIPDKQPLALRESILNIMDYYQLAAEENHTQLVCHGDGVIQADPVLFKRVIHNLLSNALKYTREGKIQVHIVTAPEKGVEILIQDTGIGIEERHLPKIFDRFYRVDPSRHSQSGGLGLGLSIVKSIMQLHQGTIHIQSQEQIGTTIHLCFPA